MRVLHYVKHFSPLSETFVYNLIVDLKTRGLHNFVLTHERMNSDMRPYQDVFKLPGESSFFKREFVRVLKKWGFYKYCLNVDAWKDVLKKTSPDLIHCHFGKSGFYASHAFEKLKSNIPLLISFHGTDVLQTPKKDNFYRNRINEISNWENIVFTTPTNFLKEKAKINFGINDDKIIVNPNGFHSSFTDYFRDKKLNTSSSFKIINIARFIEWKGHDYLLKAFSQFVETVTPNARLTLIGYGDRKPVLISLINELKLTQKVDILESVPHQDIPKILKEHDLYIQPSITDQKSSQAESFGVTILEAVAIGLPIIVTDSGGMQEVILGGDKKTAFVVAEKDAEALYAAISDVYKNTRNLDSELRDRILTCYNQENNTSTIVRLYEKLLSST